MYTRPLTNTTANRELMREFFNAGVHIYEGKFWEVEAEEYLVKESKSGRLQFQFTLVERIEGRSLVNLTVT